MKTKRNILLIVISIFMVSTIFSVGTSHAAKYKWRIATEEYDTDFQTVWAKKFAKTMNEWSNGEIEITVYPYGTLGDIKDINEAVQDGLIQFATTSYGWVSSIVPQAQVFSLHYLWPQKNTFEIMHEVVKNGEAVKILEEKFRKKDLIPLTFLPEGWHWITSKKPIKSIDDFKGFKIRVSSSKMLVENFRSYGAAPTPMGFGELYSGLQLGIVEGQSNPIVAVCALKLHEVQQYATLTWAEIYTAIPIVNRDFFESLPNATQEKIKETWTEFIKPSGEWAKNWNQECLDSAKQEQPDFQFYEFTEKDIVPFKERAQNVYKIYEKIGGKGAPEILKALLDDIQKAETKLNLK